MKTSDEILLFLVKNSRPEYYVYPVSGVKTYLDPPKKKTKKEKRNDVLLRLSGTTRYLCESKKLEEFLGEEIDFEKHLRQLHDDGILNFGVAEKDSFYDSEKYRKIFAKSNGQIKDYKSLISHVAFHYRENDFLGDYKNIVENADELGF
jgi:hypothetical protein